MYALIEGSSVGNYNNPIQANMNIIQNNNVNNSNNDAMNNNSMNNNVPVGASYGSFGSAFGELNVNNNSNNIQPAYSY